MLFERSTSILQKFSFSRSQSRALYLYQNCFSSTNVFAISVASQSLLNNFSVCVTRRYRLRRKFLVLKYAKCNGSDSKDAFQLCFLADTNDFNQVWKKNSSSI